MDNENEVIDSTNDTEDTADTSSSESLDAAAKLTALEEQNKKLYARAKKAEGFALNDEGQWVKKPVPRQNISDEKPTKPSDILKSDEFRLHRMGYNEDEIDLIMHNGGAKILEKKDSPLVLGLERSREQRKAELAAAETNSTSGLSDLERKYTKQELENMSVAELDKILPHAN